MTNCKTLLHVAAFNAQTLLSDDRFIELETKLKFLKWDVLGLCEVRRDGEELIILTSRDVFCYKEGKLNSECRIGFLIKKEH